jgi:hypothetical protein
MGITYPRPEAAIMNIFKKNKKPTLGTIHIPQEKIYELGNSNTVAYVSSIPNVTYDLEDFKPVPQWNQLS